MGLLLQFYFARNKSAMVGNKRIQAIYYPLQIKSRDWRIDNTFVRYLGQQKISTDPKLISDPVALPEETDQSEKEQYQSNSDNYFAIADQGSYFS